MVVRTTEKELTVAVDLATAGTGFMKATVTVSYTDGAAAARSVALTTVLTNYTP